MTIGASRLLGRCFILEDRADRHLCPSAVFSTTCRNGAASVVDSAVSSRGEDYPERGAGSVLGLGSHQPVRGVGIYVPGALDRSAACTSLKRRRLTIDV
jgi:hypothetical protein